MKKILYTTLAFFAACFTAAGQTAQQGVSIESATLQAAGGNLDIDIILKASGLDIRCGGQLKVEFAVENADRRLVLPSVVYSGAQRYRYERRKDALSGSYIVQPYHIYKGVRKNRTYTLDYRMSVPYYSWMEQASLTRREYTHDCSGDRLASQETLASPAPAAVPELIPEVWAPDPALFPNLVNFLRPAVEEVKARAAMIELPIGFPVNVTEVRPDFGNNRYELARADSLVGMLGSNELIRINAVNIRGYASPEGSYTSNERLARGRSESFKQYLAGRFPDNLYVRNAHTSWVPEDWGGFGKMVEADNTIAQKQDILAIVNDSYIAPDTKDVMLKKIGWWAQNYSTVVLRGMYPKLRRIELTVDYTIENLTDSKARELLYTNPDMLSQDEIYRVAQFYEPGSRQYREVYEIAARQYPKDLIANNNAAAALLQEGNAEQALPYLEKTKGSDSSLINYGAYYYINGDLDKALEYFNKAKKAGVEQADHNLRLIAPKQK